MIERGYGFPLIVRPAWATPPVWGPCCMLDAATGRRCTIQVPARWSGSQSCEAHLEELAEAIARAEAEGPGA